MNEEKYGCFRLQNLGNTCFINSIIQILSHTPIFREYILTGGFVDVLKDKSKDEDENEYRKKFKDNIIYELSRLLSCGFKNPESNITPTTLKKTISTKLSENCMFMGTKQHDSHELLTFLLDKLISETSIKSVLIGGRLPHIKTNKKKLSGTMFQLLGQKYWDNYIKSEGYSPLLSMFTGLENLSTECNYCGHTIQKFEPFKFLELPVPVKLYDRSYSQIFTLNDCLDEYVKDEKLDKHNMYRCNVCGFKSQAVKKLQLYKTPKILIIHLKRFKKNMYGVTSEKIKNKIEFPINNLDIKPYVSKFNTESTKYNLIGVNKHYELNSYYNIGHYISLCKSEFDNKWYCYNDSSPIREVTNINDLKNDAYLLIYYRID